MISRILIAVTTFFILSAGSSLSGQPPEVFHVLAFYSMSVEADHVAFAKQALNFYNDAAKRDHFDFVATTDWDEMNEANLDRYQAVLWLNDSPHTEQQRRAFESYMTHGGGWLGFHASAYNDQDTHWPWFVTFLGGAVFYGNNWPPLPARLVVEKTDHPVTLRLPRAYVAPANEWYSWKPDPRLNKDVIVLLSLDPRNYPLGLKDTLNGGDIPIVWTNTAFKMVYMNMGHGDKIFSDPTQNLMFEDALRWVGRRN